MIKYLLLFLLPLSLFASKILSYNIYDRTDRADVMLTFDTPYSGIIKQNRGKSKIIIKLENASIESPKIKKVSSKFLQSVVITPLQNETQIVATVPQSVKLIASKTADGYGLRLRFTNKTARKNFAQNSSIQNSSEMATGLPTQKNNGLSKSYYIVVAILIIGILILLYIKKKTTPQQKMQTKQQKSNWLFNANTQSNQEQTQQTTNTTQSNANEVSIRFQKAIDTDNSVVMLDFGQESYLVLMGKSNILLDKFHDNKPSSQQEFETILQSRHEELENFLHGQNTQKSNNHGEKEPLQAYKERAASLIYNDEI